MTVGERLSTPMKIGISSGVIKLVVYAVVAGMTVATFRDSIAQKADKTEVQAMASDIKAIRSMICHQQPMDSFCQRTP